MMRSTTTPLWQEMRQARATPDEILRHFRIFEPPVDVVSLARRMGVEVRFVRDAPWSGHLQVKDGRALIEVRELEQSPFRQRFTVAHELGHLLLHPLREAFRDNDAFAGGPRETQANAFAAGLLMPLWMLDPIAMSSRATLSSLTRTFEVSEAAMRIRLGQLAGLK